MKLREWRIKRNLSQSELAAKAGLHQTAVAHYESGRRDPSLENMVGLSVALGITMDALFHGEGVVTDYDRGFRDGVFSAREKMKSATRELL